MTVRSRQEPSFRACAPVSVWTRGHVGSVVAGVHFHHLIATLWGRCRYEAHVPGRVSSAFSTQPAGRAGVLGARRR